MNPQASERPFFAVSVLFFAASTSLTIVPCNSMPDMGAIPMPGNWAMSMVWMRMPGETWLAAAVSFLGMWIPMTVAMMMPSLVAMLRHYRQAVPRTGETRLGRLTTLAGAGYFSVWTALGTVAFPLGAALAGIEMWHPSLSRAVPFAAGAIVLTAGALQFTRWKAHRLACCRDASGCGCRLPAVRALPGGTVCVSISAAAPAARA